MNEYPRHVRLLVQDATEYTLARLMEAYPPHSLEDMTTYRLSNLDTFAEMAEGVLSDPKLAVFHGTWRRMRQEGDRLMPVWTAGIQAYERARETRLENPQDVGTAQARLYYPQKIASQILTN